MSVDSDNLKMRNIIFICTLFIISTISLNSCRSDNEKQNLDINVFGNVSGTDLSIVKIFIQRGKFGNYAPPNYSNFETIYTVNGYYKYVIKDDGFTYQVCCELPDGYSYVTPGCKEVDHTIINSKTIPNQINFILKKN